MKRIAIVGGGLSGLTAAYELEMARKRGAAIDWQLYEASDRLGGIVETTRHVTPEGEWILEGGPDGWVSEKPWARDLAIELGLEADLIYSNDATRKTYIYLDGRLQPLPDRMRMMVPEDLATLETSPLFSSEARQAYADELNSAAKLKAASPFADETYDESVATFVRRHFGDEVLTKLAAPLLSGVFGGDVETLSVRAVMAPFVAMEQQHGSLIAALQSRRGKSSQPIFTSLRRGLASLTEALIATLPTERLHLRTPVVDIADERRWHVVYDELDRVDSRSPKPIYADKVDVVILATSRDVTWRLLRCVSPDTPPEDLLPTNASSAVLVAFAWNSTFDIPPGFGFLVPPSDKVELLAATFVDQKFPHRAPANTRIIRAFFGTGSAEHFANSSDIEVAGAAMDQLQAILGQLPKPNHSTVSRWPRSLPQYAVGHLERIRQLDLEISKLGNLRLLGNSYRGVGLPDLIRDARQAARSIL